MTNPPPARRLPHLSPSPAHCTRFPRPGFDRHRRVSPPPPTRRHRTNRFGLPPQSAFSNEVRFEVLAARVPRVHDWSLPVLRGAYVGEHEHVPGALRILAAALAARQIARLRAAPPLASA